MIPSFFRVNFWMAVLLATTVFSGICLEESTGFTARTATTRTRSTPTPRTLERVSCTPLTFRMSTVTDAPTKKEKTVEVIKDEDTEQQQKPGKNGWEIQLFNDPFNQRTFVAKCLCTICGKSDGESYQIMMQAHKNGMGVVGRYHYEIAELYYGSLKGEGLTVQMVEVDDE
uniref:Adaptor protein ClpS core domain-containing protein n=2 Tax=Pseudo-nitzschia australis TaxID=44445 RepID=A0A7S4AB74_9STRA|mmetsp:Transcript_27447/g.60411  ORF Transcript_27447/g.60411 Transcript_27447/m.60411 type:complete len:171 (+) Transcript_27447:206-718(+)